MERLDALCCRLASICAILVFLAGCTVTHDHAVDPATRIKVPTRGIDIYLLIGQSNMAGRAQILAPDFDTLQGVFLFTGDSLHPWEPAANPLNKYSTIRRELSVQQLGPGYYFAKTIMTNGFVKSLGLVMNARGGTSIDLWAPGTSYFNDAVLRARQARRSGTLKAILWHQGESDVKKYREYPEKIVTLINALRMELNLSDLPFIAGELAEEKINRAEFNRMLKETLSKVPYTSVVSSKGLTTYDSTHFDTRSMRILGERYAIATRSLIVGDNENTHGVHK